MTLTDYRIDRDGADQLLIVLHGWSAEQHHLAAYVPLVDPDGRFTATAPRAPHDLPDGDGASWYDRGEDGPDEASFASAIELLDAYVAAQMERTGIPAERTVIGGFSQGGFLALSLVLRSGAPAYGGVWAMCCSIFDTDRIQLETGVGNGRPSLIQYGELDEIITPDRSETAAARLVDGGWDVTTRSYPMAHSQRIEMMIDARDWLAGID